MILYLHGFRSSPHSMKARLLAQAMALGGRADEFVCPQLPASPAEAIALAEHAIETQIAQHGIDSVCLIGSSLGGYYATYLAEKYGCRAMLINPAVKPPRDLEKYVGVTTAYHSDEVFEFKAHYVDELHALVISQITRPERYFLMAATGDEVLDWREMQAHYPLARQQIIEGSDHSVSEFADYLDDVLAWCDE